jgi:hypothetical protein
MGARQESSHGWSSSVGNTPSLEAFPGGVPFTNVPLTETGDRSASTIPIPPIGVANFFIPEFVISAELSGRASNTLL